MTATGRSRGPDLKAKTIVSPRHLVFTVILLVALVGTYMFLDARRNQGEMERELRERSTALLGILQTSARNAIAGNALTEELIGRRLLDNAYLIDQLLASRGFDAAQMDQIVARNHLRKVEFLDRTGQKLARPPLQRSEGRGSAPPSGMGTMGMGTMDPAMHERMREEMERSMGSSGGGPGRGGWMMPFMWGWRWREPQPPAAQAPVPPAVQDRKFWEGSDYGVAIPATSFPGIIAVHADARTLLEFREQIGIQRLLEELGRQADIAYVALLDANGQVVAHSDPSRVGTRRPAEVPGLGPADGWPTQRQVARRRIGQVYEVARPFPLGRNRVGVLRLGLSVGPIQAVWAQDRRNMVIYTGSILLVGILGVLAIFLNQRRYLRGVRALEEEVRLRERLASMGNLAAGVAHEVRNPLNAISLGIQRLRREFAPAGAAERAEYDRFTEVVQGEVNRLNGIVERFLQLARPVPVQPKACDVSSLITDLVALMGPEATRRNITLRPLVPGPLPARIDPDQITQVLHNLVSNAFQAMAKGGEVRVEAKAADGELSISVTDQGEGIPSGDLGKIFEPYFTTRDRGTGLGLAIAHRIVEDHGGRIEVESRVGVGSTFRVRLPLDDRKASA